jgi:hydrogenase maturation protease
MIKKLLNDLKGKRILFAGVGNVLKQDDGVGVYISEKIKQSQNIQALTVEVSIENYIGKINSLQPDSLILIDAMDFARKPGYFNLLPIEKVNGYTTNTHNNTLDKVSELFNSQVYILGLQPKTVSFGEGLTRELKYSADSVISEINGLC